MTLLSVQRAFRIWLTTEPSELPAPFDERAAPGLAVYLNNYRLRLLSCLSISFPAVRVWIGDTAFEGAAASHIDRVPPHAWSADAYGVDFPETLERLYPNDPEIAELARLERELAAAFVGADAEAVDARALIDIDWDAARIDLVPTLTLLPVTTNVAAIWSAIQEHEKPPAVAYFPEPALLIIWRDGLVPRFRTVVAEEACALGQVLEGKSFGSLCSSLVERMDQERAVATASSFLSQWLSDRMIVRIDS